jgi:NAD(P)-dependent dehydrogenase (short-subunit alcohol dehydrogenase family)
MDGRRVLVTGASSGIGRATAVLLSELGASVVLVGRNEERLAETASQLKGSGHQLASFDLAETDAIPAWVKKLTEQGGSLDGLAHCAGLQLTYPLRATTWNHVEELMRLNVGAALALARGLRQKGANTGSGSVVLLSSAAGLVGEPARAAYSASKAAVVGLSRSLAVELARENIRVNCVAPGVVETPMWEETKRSLTPEQAEEIAKKHPLGVGQPRDVASAIAFLLSDAGRWITGTTLVVDGGFIAGK